MITAALDCWLQFPVHYVLPGSDFLISFGPYISICLLTIDKGEFFFLFFFPRGNYFTVNIKSENFEGNQPERILHRLKETEKFVS